MLVLPLGVSSKLARAFTQIAFTALIWKGFLDLGISCVNLGLLVLIWYLCHDRCHPFVPFGCICWEMRGAAVVLAGVTQHLLPYGASHRCLLILGLLFVCCVPTFCNAVSIRGSHHPHSSRFPPGFLALCNSWSLLQVFVKRKYWTCVQREGKGRVLKTPSDIICDVSGLQFPALLSSLLLLGADWDLRVEQKLPGVFSPSVHCISDVGNIACNGSVI